MKRILFLLLVLGFVQQIWGVADTLSLSAPEYLNSFYDHYTRNYMSAWLAGKGNTGVASLGDGTFAIYNPASLDAQNTDIYFEAVSKMPIDEYITYYDKDRRLIYTTENFESPKLLGTVGASFRLTDKSNLAFTYHLAQSLEYNAFMRDLATDEEIRRYPTFLNHEFTSSYCYRFDNGLRLGMNLVMNYYYMDEYKLEGTYRNIEVTKTIFRLQPGIQYRTSRIAFGASYLFGAKTDFDCEAIDYKDTKIPSIMRAGVELKLNDVTTADLDFEYEKCSDMNSAFDDRLVIKGGIEKRFVNYMIRGGFISFPSVYSGYYYIPVANDNISPIDMDQIPRYGHVDKIKQTYLTGGLTFFVGKYSKLNFGLVTGAFSDISNVELISGLSLNVDALSKFWSPKKQER